MMRRVVWMCACLSLAAGLVACEEEDALQGSLTEVYDTSFSTTRARLYPSELSIEYVREDGQVPVRVTVRREDGVLGVGTYVLGTRGDVTGRSGDVDMPPLAGGSVVLERFGGQAGSTVEGRFDARFLTGEETSSLSGSFVAPLEVIEASEGYESEAYPPGRTCVGAVPLAVGSWVSGVLSEDDSDDVDSSCGVGGGVFAYRVEVEAAEVLEEGVEPEVPVYQVQVRVEEGVRVALMQGVCSAEALRVCALEASNEEYPLGAGLWYLVAEGVGAYEVRVRRR